MSHFVYVRTGGTWAALSVLLSSEEQLFDQQLYKAVNGDDGGAWAPADQIIVGGAGIDCTGDFYAGSARLITLTPSLGHIEATSGTFVNIDAGASLNHFGAMRIEPDATVEFMGSLLHPSIITHDANTLDNYSSGAVMNFGGAFFGTGAFSWSSAATCLWSGICEFDSTVTFNGASVNLSGGSTFTHGSSSTVTKNGPTVVSGSTATTRLRVAQTSDANGTYGAEEDHWIVNYTAARTYTIRESTAPIPAVGMKIVFTSVTNLSGAGTLTFKREDGSTLATSPTTSTYWWLEIMYVQAPGDSTPRWHCTRWSQDFTPSTGTIS